MAQDLSLCLWYFSSYSIPRNYLFIIKQRPCLHCHKGWCLVHSSVSVKMYWWGPSLVAQWWRICLPVQEIRVRFLIWKDPTWHRGATEPMHCNDGAYAWEPGSSNYWAQAPQSHAPQHRDAHCSKEELLCAQLEKSPRSNTDQAWPKTINLSKQWKYPVKYTISIR